MALAVLKKLLFCLMDLETRASYAPPFGLSSYGFRFNLFQHGSSGFEHPAQRLSRESSKSRLPPHRLEKISRPLRLVRYSVSPSAAQHSPLRCMTARRFPLPLAGLPDRFMLLGVTSIQRLRRGGLRFPVSERGFLALSNWPSSGAQYADASSVFADAGISSNCSGSCLPELDGGDAGRTALIIRHPAPNLLIGVRTAGEVLHLLLDLLALLLFALDVDLPASSWPPTHVLPFLPQRELRVSRYSSCLW